MGIINLTGNYDRKEERREGYDLSYATYALRCHLGLHEGGLFSHQYGAHSEGSGGAYRKNKLQVYDRADLPAGGVGEEVSGSIRKGCKVHKGRQDRDC